MKEIIDYMYTHALSLSTHTHTHIQTHMATCIYHINPHTSTQYHTDIVVVEKVGGAGELGYTPGNFTLELHLKAMFHAFCNTPEAN